MTITYQDDSEKEMAEAQNSLEKENTRSWRDVAYVAGERVMGALTLLGVGYLSIGHIKHSAHEQGRLEAIEEMVQKEDLEQHVQAKDQAWHTIAAVRSETFAHQNQPEAVVDPLIHNKLIFAQTSIHQVAEITSSFDSAQDRNEAVRIILDSDDCVEMIQKSGEVKSQLNSIPPEERLEKLEKMSTQKNQVLDTIGKFTERLAQEQAPQGMER